MFGGERIDFGIDKLQMTDGPELKTLRREFLLRQGMLGGYCLLLELGGVMFKQRERFCHLIETIEHGLSIGGACFIVCGLCLALFGLELPTVPDGLRNPRRQSPDIEPIDKIRKGAPLRVEGAGYGEARIEIGLRDANFGASFAHKRIGGHDVGS